MGWVASRADYLGSRANLKLRMNIYSNKIQEDGANLQQRSWIFHAYVSMTMKCHSIVHHRWFSLFVTGVIFVALINLGLETDYRFMSDPIRAQVVVVIEDIIVASFVMEVVLKVLSYGTQPFAYLRKRWNVFDLCVAITSLVQKARSGAILVRVLRLQRVIKVARQFPQLTIIVSALFDSMISVSSLALILGLFIYVYAIIGMSLFSQSDPWYFGSLHISLFTLLRAATYDNTFEIMYVNQYGCDKYQDIYASYPELCTQPIAYGWYAVVYFLSYAIIAGQVMVNLFIGVVSTGLETARTSKRRELKLEQDLIKRAAKLRLDSIRVNAFRQVFGMLDLDEGGLVEADELKLGLTAINLKISNSLLEELLDIVDPHRDGLHIIGFIDFMSMLPSYRHSLGQIAEVFRNDRSRIPVSRMRRFLDRIFRKRAIRQATLKTEAALTIQECWAEYKKRNKAKLLELTKNNQIRRIPIRNSKNRRKSQLTSTDETNNVGTTLDIDRNLNLDFQFETGTIKQSSS
jgi:voltage-gated sodium channel